MLVALVALSNHLRKQPKVGRVCSGLQFKAACHRGAEVMGRGDLEVTLHLQADAERSMLVLYPYSVGAQAHGIMMSTYSVGLPLLC